MTSSSPLSNVELFLFDTFGTLTDWETSVSRLLKQQARSDSKKRSGHSSGLAAQVNMELFDWLEFTRSWRKGYMRRTREIANGGEGPSNIDALHLELLNSLLDSEEYETAGQLWATEGERRRICLFWHEIEAWPDVKPGMGLLRKLSTATKPVLLATLSNGSLRLLVDVARTNSLHFDAHFSGDLLESYKPNRRMYEGGPRLLGYGDEDIQAGKVAMVASHIYDLEAAARFGLKTIYISRRTEDNHLEGDEAKENIKATKDGGKFVDVVLKNGLEELRSYVRR